MRNNWQIIEQNQGRGQGGFREAGEAAKAILPEEVEEDIREEANFNRFLELLMDLDSSISEIDSGLNTTHLLPTHHIYSTSSLEKSKRY